MTGSTPMLNRTWQLVGREIEDGDGSLVWTYAPFSEFTIHEGRDAGLIVTVTGRDSVTKERTLMARLAS